MTELEQPFRRHAGRRGTRIYPRQLGPQVVYAQRLLIERAFKRDPIFGDGQIIEDGRQAIIIELARLEPAAQTAPQSVLVRLDPRLDVRQPVVAFGQDEGQPDNDDPTQAEALPITVGGNVFV